MADQKFVSKGNLQSTLSQLKSKLDNTYATTKYADSIANSLSEYISERDCYLVKTGSFIQTGTWEISEEDYNTVRDIRPREIIFEGYFYILEAYYYQEDGGKTTNGQIIYGDGTDKKVELNQGSRYTITVHTNAYIQQYQVDDAYDHSRTTHAPVNAQKNSDITKAEIEAKLTGDIATHTHSQYLTQHQDISSKADITYVDQKLSEVATSGFTVLKGTEESPVIISELTPGVLYKIENYFKYTETGGISTLQLPMYINIFGINATTCSFVQFNSRGTNPCGINVINLENNTCVYYNLVRENQVLTKTNTAEYTPTNNYHPTTKKYVDDKMLQMEESIEDIFDTDMTMMLYEVYGIEPEDGSMVPIVFDLQNSYEIVSQTNPTTKAIVGTTYANTITFNKPAAEVNVYMGGSRYSGPIYAEDSYSITVEFTVHADVTIQVSKGIS